jgi:hypothetical protein
MSLEIDGKPFGLTQDQTEKYSKKMVFRIGKQFVTPNRTGDPEVPALSTSAVHVMPQYRHYEMTGKTKMPKGLLVYFQQKRWDDTAKRNEYEPARVEITYKGYMESTDPELNFFLDNHPNNEQVKNDREHPNHDPKAETYFSTYVKANRRDLIANNMATAAKLTTLLFDKQKTSNKDAKDLAQLVQRFAKDYALSHKLHNLEDMDNEDIRTELARLANVDPLAMDSIMGSKSLDYLSTVNRFVELQIIKQVGSDWMITENGKPTTLLMKVPSGHDAKISVVDWFKKFDTKGAKMKMLKGRLEEIELSQQTTA